MGNPAGLSDPIGLAVGDWWDPRNLDAEFWGSTGYGLWNAASLGTLDAVTEGKGLSSAAGSAGDHLGNVSTLGLQNRLMAAADDGEITYAEARAAAGDSAYDLLPAEEGISLYYEWDDLDAAERARLIATATSKTAGLLAATGGVAKLNTAMRANAALAVAEGESLAAIRYAQARIAAQEGALAAAEAETAAAATFARQAMLGEAAVARDAYLSRLLATKSRRQVRDITTVVGAVDFDTGQIFVAAKSTRTFGAGVCAEDIGYSALGGPMDFGFTSAIRPRTGSPVDVCVRCERTFGRDVFAPGTGFESGGAR